MVSEKVTLVNPSGIDIKSAGLLSKTAQGFQSSINLIYNDKNKANVKSLLSILGAGIREGDEIEISCEGPDEEQALKEIISLIESGLGEENG